VAAAHAEPLCHESNDRLVGLSLLGRRRNLDLLGHRQASLGRDDDDLLDLRETADYGGVAEAPRATTAKAIEKESAIL
jgi:hypothetical protein